MVIKNMSPYDIKIITSTVQVGEEEDNMVRVH